MVLNFVWIVSFFSPRASRIIRCSCLSYFIVFVQPITVVWLSILCFSWILFYIIQFVFLIIGGGYIYHIFLALKVVIDSFCKLWHLMSLHVQQTVVSVNVIVILCFQHYSLIKLFINIVICACFLFVSFTTATLLFLSCLFLSWLFPSLNTFRSCILFFSDEIFVFVF